MILTELIKIRLRAEKQENTDQEQIKSKKEQKESRLIAKKNWCRAETEQNKNIKV